MYPTSTVLCFIHCPLTSRKIIRTKLVENENNKFNPVNNNKHLIYNTMLVDIIAKKISTKFE